MKKVLWTSPKKKAVSVFLILILIVTSGLSTIAATKSSTQKTNNASPFDPTLKIGSKSYKFSEIEKESKASQLKDLPVFGLPTVGTEIELLRMMWEMQLITKPAPPVQPSASGDTDDQDYEDYVDDYYDEEPAEEDEPPVAYMDTDEADDYSTTNTQVSGVDEGDILKTDGAYIYYADKEKISIFKVNGANMERVSLINPSMLEMGELQDMYVAGNYLIVSLYDDYDSTYYVVYDISDRKNPVVSRYVRVCGQAISTRLIGNTLYFATSVPLPRLFQGTRLTGQDLLPDYTDSAVSNKVQYVPLNQIYYTPGKLEPSYMLVGAFEVDGLKACDITTILGAGEDLYMNKEALILANWSWQSNKTLLYRFDIQGTKLRYAGAGRVDGYLLDQYAMDVYNGYLRVATTSTLEQTSEKKDKDGNPIVTQTTQTNVFVLNPSMKLSGSVRGLAPGERIYAVRYRGDTAYVVTYLETDPLYVIDLARPSSPAVAGELKIPGFSTYLHPIGSDLLLGIGRNATGSTVRGVKVSLFDVSNPHKPKELYANSLGTESGYTPVLNNPRALFVDSKRGYIGLPFSDDQKWNEHGVLVKDIWSGGTILSVSRDKGFRKVADLVETDSGYDEITAHTRICYIGKTLYLVSPDYLTAYNYDTFEQQKTLYINKFLRD